MTSPTERRYRRLPGRPFSPFRRDSLWLAEDHVLSVQSNRFSETYRRYYFRDIQAFTIQRTASISPWTFAVGTVAAVFLAPGLFFDFQSPFLWVTGGLFLAITLAFIGLGPTCACYIQTAVSRERLGSLRWIRTAEKALDMLQPGIEQVQGAITPEIAALPSEPPPIPGAAIQPPPLPTYKQPETGWAYEFLFVLLLLDALHAYLSLHYKGTPIQVAGWAILVTEIVFVLSLIVRQRRFEVPGAIRVIVILTLIVTAGFNYVGFMLNSVSTQLKTGTQTAFAAMNIADTAIFGVMGIAGFILMARYRQSLRRMPPASTPK